MSVFRSKIGEIIELKKLTPFDISELTGLSEATIIRLSDSKNLNNISLRTIFKIADALECSPNDLFEEK